MGFYRFFLIYCFFVGFIYASMAFSNESTGVVLNDFKRERLLGEFDSGLYSGPRFPFFKMDNEYRQIFFLDDDLDNAAFGTSRQLGLDSLEEFFSRDMELVNRCSDEDFNKHIIYIRYLYRLLTISYLFEMLKNYHQTVLEFGLDSRLCLLTWENTFQRCRPKYLEMKKLLSRVKPVYQQALEKTHYNILNDTKKKNIADFFRSQLNSDKELFHPVLAQIAKKSHRNKSSGLNIQVIEKEIASLCQRDLQLMINLCSESDSLYGLSYVELATSLIKQSHALSILGYNRGEACVDRYVAMFQPSEVSYEWLKDIFFLVYQHLLGSKQTYLEGVLYLPGTLKEFDDKGLTEFLFSLSPAPVPAPTPAPTPTPTPVITISPDLISDLPRLESIITSASLSATANLPSVKKEIVKAEQKPIKIIQPTPRIPHFEAMATKRRQTNSLRTEMNMDLFYQDFVFTKVVKEKLEKSLSKYQTRKALRDMQVFDKLGTKKEPLRLMFLKFLIDNNHHQGLYNIQAVIGKQFWCLNDIDGKIEPEYIEIENSKQTNYRWIISILRPPPTEKADK